ncbi:hypothetical protein PG988_015385 [Apiospora saccharicola]
MDTLLKAGISVDVEGQDGHPPLHLSSLSGNIRMAVFLLQKGADINAKDRLRMTPIILAGHQKQRHAMELLLRLGASITGISRKEWLEYFDKKGDPIPILEITESSKAKQIHFIPDPQRGQVERANTDQAPRRLRSYADYGLFYATIKDNYPGNAAQLLNDHQPVIVEEKSDSWVYNFVQVCYPQSATHVSNSWVRFRYDVKPMVVHWKLSKDTTKLGPADDWETTHYATTLEFGHIPNDPLELLTYLCERNEERWILFCNAVDEYTADLEFAWVSIREAHLSTSLATSIKRLSWITFVFLPITFTAVEIFTHLRVQSVFGMNVNLFKDNPEWWWFVIVSGVVLGLTILGWLCFKYGQLETYLEAQIGQRLERLFGLRQRGKDAENSFGRQDEQPWKKFECDYGRSQWRVVVGHRQRTPINNLWPRASPFSDIGPRQTVTDSYISSNWSSLFQAPLIRRLSSYGMEYPLKGFEIGTEEV